MKYEWATDIRDQCLKAGVPFFFKQYGEWLPIHETEFIIPNGRTYEDMGWRNPKEYLFPDGSISVRLGKKTAGRLLDGREWNEIPKKQEVKTPYSPQQKDELCQCGSGKKDGQCNETPNCRM